MIILNTTFFVPEYLEAELLDWARNTYVKAAVEEASLLEPQIALMITRPADETSGIAVQMSHPEASVLEQWNDNRGKALRDDLAARHKEEILFFSTFLNRVL